MTTYEKIMMVYNTSLGFLNGTALYGGTQSIYCNGNFTTQLNIAFYSTPIDILAFASTKNVSYIYQPIYDISGFIQNLFGWEYSCRLSVPEATKVVDQYM